MDPVLLTGIYDYAADSKMSHHQLDRAASPPMHDAAGYGPFLGQYWNFVQGSIANAGIPLTQNGNYVSPYCAPADPYFASAPDHAMPMAGTVASMGAVDDSLFASHRDSGYESAILPQDGSIYPEPVDGHPWQYPSVDPTLQMQSLQLLDNLANQILRDVISTSVQDFMSVINGPDSPRGQAYATLLALFEQNKKVFSRDRIFINPADNQQFNNPAYTRMFRKANLATFVSCIFRGHDVPFLDLDDSFLDIFMPAGTRLLKSEGALLLELKTQAYIAIMLSSEASREEMLDSLFPRDLHLAILRRRPEPTHLAPSEQDFIGRLNTRRQYLSAGSQTMESLQQLPQKYNWKDFLDEVVHCVRRALEAMDAINVSTPLTVHVPRATLP